MAWKEISEPDEFTVTIAADTDADLTDIALADYKIGTLVIAANAGDPRWYLKFPGGSFYKILGEDAPTP